MQSHSLQLIASEALSLLPKPNSTVVQLEMGVEGVSGSRIGTFERVREQEILVFPTVWKKRDSAPALRARLLELVQSQECLGQM